MVSGNKRTMHWTLQDAIWVWPTFLEAITAGVMVRRKLWRDFPVFWTFLLFEVARTCVLFGIGMGKERYATYFYAFWITEGLASFLGFFVVREIFRKVFPRRLGLQRLGSTVFGVSLLLLIVVALYAASAAPGGDASKLVAGIYVIKRADSILRLGLLVTLFVSIFLFGLPWTDYLFGIALGLALYDAVELAALAIRAHYGRSANSIYSWSRIGANVCQKLIWAGYFFRRRSPSNPRFADALLTALELEKMNEAVESAVIRS